MCKACLAGACKRPVACVPALARARLGSRTLQVHIGTSFVRDSIAWATDAGMGTVTARHAHIQPLTSTYLLSTTTQGLGDALLDEHQTAQVARPGTSMARPGTGAQVGS